MKTFYDFLQNGKTFVFQEQNPVIDPVVSGFLQGSGVTPELEKLGNRLGVGAKNIVTKTGKGIGRALFGQRTNQFPDQPQVNTPSNTQQFAGGTENRELRKKYFELQNALKNYYNAIDNNPSLKNSPQVIRIKSMLEKIEDELESIYFSISQVEKNVVPPTPLRGTIKP